MAETAHPEPKPRPSVLGEPSVVDLIRQFRGTRVMLDADLAGIYGVKTKALNQAVKRNARRFPPDFMFRLSSEETEELRRSRSQIVTLKRGQNVKHPPLAFTEHGAIMVASLLNSPRAEDMSVFVVRAFVRLRDLAQGRADFAKQLTALEHRVAGHDEALKRVFAAVRGLLPLIRPKTSRPIGFTRSS
jgi:hypothetical protein